jgi:glycosyltransferase involved in cell wall biosynthesis
LEVLVCCTSLERELDPGIEVVETMVVAGRRVPHRAIGVQRAYEFHDRRAARLLRRRAHDVDVVHVWPAGCLQTIAAANQLGLPTVREVPNTHTAHAFDVAAAVYQELGLRPPSDHSHTPDGPALRRELTEYDAVDMLLVPSLYSLETFRRAGVPESRLALHQYGFDPASFHPQHPPAHPDHGGIRAVFIGSCEPRKGLHLALRAWMDSGAAERGRFVICGDFVPGYREALEPWLAHPSVVVRGFTDEPARLLAESDVLVLPSLEEGSALVTYEAQASGCALVVSDATGAMAEHGVEA